MFVMLEGFEHGMLVLRSPSGQIMWVLGLLISSVENKEAVTRTLAGGESLLPSCPAILPYQSL